MHLSCRSFSYRTSLEALICTTLDCLQRARSHCCGGVRATVSSTHCSHPASPNIVLLSLATSPGRCNSEGGSTQPSRSHTHRKKVCSCHPEHCNHQISSTSANSFCHHVTDQRFQTLHWWHCRKQITRFVLVVFRSGFLDLSHNQSCSDLFSLVFQNPLQ